jgi:threonine dehydrogenase-like Zn-dependent dehydrogenase
MLELYLKRPYELELRESHSSDFLQEGEVKIKLIYGGICGSDLRVFQGSLAHASYPSSLNDCSDQLMTWPYWDDSSSRLTYCGYC